MNYIVSVKQEDTSDTFKVSPFAADELVNNLSDPGWVCNQLVISSDGKYRIHESQVTTKSTDDLYFTATLEPAVTAELNKDQYIWVIEVENPLLTPKYRREVNIVLSVAEHKLWSSAETQTEYDIVSFVGTAIRINTLSFVAGTVSSIKLLDADDNVIQTSGWVSDTVDVTETILVIKEPVIDTPVKVRILT